MEFTARIDGEVVYVSPTPERVSVSGRATIGFDVPEDVSGRNGVVTAIVVSDGTSRHISISQSYRRDTSLSSAFSTYLNATLLHSSF